MKTVTTPLPIPTYNEEAYAELKQRVLAAEVEARRLHEIHNEGLDFKASETTDVLLRNLVSDGVLFDLSWVPFHYFVQKIQNLEPRGLQRPDAGTAPFEVCEPGPVDDSTTTSTKSKHHMPHGVSRANRSKRTVQERIALLSSMVSVGRGVRVEFGNMTRDQVAYQVAKRRKLSHSIDEQANHYEKLLLAMDERGAQTVYQVPDDVTAECMQTSAVIEDIPDED